MAYQELERLCQRKRWELTKNGPSSSGPSHKPIFTCSIEVQDESTILYQTTKKASKKSQAEKDAVAGILEQIDPSLYILHTNNFNELKHFYPLLIKEDIKYEFVKKGSEHEPEFHAKASIEVEGKKFESNGTGQNKAAAKKSAEANIVLSLKNSINEKNEQLYMKEATKSPIENNDKQEINRYRTPSYKEGRVGKGSYGHVHVCVDERNPSKYLAVKIPPGEADEEDANIFKREMEFLAKHTKSDFVVNFHGALHFEDRIGFLMDYYPAGTLKKIIYSKKMYPSLIYKVFKRLAEGIQYLHKLDGRKRITHNDIKPDNILLSNKFEPLLCDFGGSTHATKTSIRSSGDHPKDGALDTSFYRGPEFPAMKDYLRSTTHDVYCFGVSLFEAISKGFDSKLTDQKRFCELYKFHQRKLFQNYRRHLKDLEDEKQYEEADLLYDFEKFVHDLCQKDPEKRPKIQEVFEKIEKIPTGCIESNQCENELKKDFRRFKYDESWVPLNDIWQEIRKL